jgi:hypothetical protein
MSILVCLRGHHPAQEAIEKFTFYVKYKQGKNYQRAVKLDGLPKRT